MSERRAPVGLLAAMLALGCGPKSEETEGTGSSGQMTSGASTGSTSGSGTETGTGSGTSGTATSEPTTGGTTTGGPGSGYCPGAMPWGDGYQTCKADMDCPQPFQYCTPAPGASCGPGCGSSCQTDDECAQQDPGLLCQIYPHPCCPDGSGTCVTACTADSCAPEHVCAPDGHCVPQPCDDGWTCAEGYGCKVEGQAPADLHGCALLKCDTPGATPCNGAQTCEGGVCTAIACEVDSDCPCGSCVQKLCYERPWICEEPAA